MVYDRVTDKVSTSAPEPGGLAAQYADMTAPPNKSQSKSSDNQGAPTSAKKWTVDEQADIPFRFIEAADPKNRGIAPEHSQRFIKNQKAEQGVPIEQQADVHRWINAAAKFEQKPREIVAKAGDTYWSVAQGIASTRAGRQASDVEVHGMVKKLAQFNGKSEAEANVLKVGQVIKVPFER